MTGHFSVQTFGHWKVGATVIVISNVGGCPEGSAGHNLLIPNYNFQQKLPRNAYSLGSRSLIKCLIFFNLTCWLKCFFKYKVSVLVDPILELKYFNSSSSCRNGFAQLIFI